MLIILGYIVPHAYFYKTKRSSSTLQALKTRVCSLINLDDCSMAHTTWCQARIARGVWNLESLSPVALVASAAIVVLPEVKSLWSVDILVRSRTFASLIDGDTNSLPVAEEAIVGAVENDSSDFFGVAEVADVGSSANVLDLLVDDGVVGVDPSGGFGVCLEVACVREINEWAFGRASVVGVAFSVDSRAPEYGVLVAVYIPNS